jgi:hypothetical protein
MNPAPESLCLPEKSDSKLLPKKRKKYDKRFQETDVASESWRLIIEL